MASPVGTPAVSGSALNTNTLTLSGVTVPAGADFMTVHLCLNNYTGTIASVVFNTSEALTQRIYQTVASSNRRTAIFYLVNPTVTTAQVVVTLSANAQQITAIAQAYAGVDPLSGTNGAANGMSLAPASTSFGLDLITTQNNSLVVDVIGVDDGAGLTPSGDNAGNEIANISVNDSEIAASFAQMGTAPDTADMDWTLALADGSMCAMELLDAGGVVDPSLLLLLHARGDD